MDNRQTYSFEEAHKASLEYFGGDDLAARVWVNKYALKDSYGNIYTPTVFHANSEEWERLLKIRSQYIHTDQDILLKEL